MAQSIGRCVRIMRLVTITVQRRRTQTKEALPLQLVARCIGKLRAIMAGNEQLLRRQ